MTSLRSETHGIGEDYSISRRVERFTADHNVRREETEKIFVAGAVDLTFNLPPTEKGLRYTFVVEQPSSSTGLSISPQSGDKIMTNGITSADDKDLINTAASDAEGDCVTIVGDGNLGWFVESLVGTWAREA